MSEIKIKPVRKPIKKDHCNKYSFGILDMWKYHLESEGTGIPYSKFSDIISTFNKKIRDEVILKGCDFYMGQRLSRIGLRKRKINPNRPVIDWVNTKKYGKWCFYTESYSPTDHYYWIAWLKKRSRVRNSIMYQFDAATTVKKKIPQKLKEDPHGFDNMVKKKYKNK